MRQPAPHSAILRVDDLPGDAPVRFCVAPPPERLEAIRADLGLLGLRKLRLEGDLRAAGNGDWRLGARLGATVTQTCVVTLAPVTTRIEEAVTRRFLRGWSAAADPEAQDETALDDTTDPLGDEIDLEEVARESLALAIPDYPRAEGAALDAVWTSADAQGDGEAARPFAALAGLKARLGGG